jgi:DNA invertase Pin-like site-specific DNA recombinase
MKVAIYCRVSTDDQNCDRQIRELTAYCDRAGWELVGIYQESASGVRNDRPVRKEVIELARRREIAAVVVSELSRWGRSTPDLLATLQELSAHDTRLVSLNGVSFDLATPTGKLMTTILAALAEFERDLLRERVKSGMVAAKARGKQLGRRPGTSDRVRQLSGKVRQYRGEGMSIRAIARHLQLSKSTVEGILRG